LAKAYGVADQETGEPANIRTLFQAGSISKPVAAMAVVKAAQDRQFTLDDDINTVLRSWKFPESVIAVTPRMLAAHVSGLGDGFGFPGYAPGAALPDPVQILEGRSPSNTPKVWLERPPLAAMKYSGGGSTVLQLALSDAIGRPFADIVQESVLEPIGMADSTFDQPPSAELQTRAARAHEQGLPLTPRWHVYPELFAAGLWTTATDLARFAIEIQLSAHGRSNRVLSRASVQEMLNPVGIGDFAVGFKVMRHGQGWYMEHTGSTHGFSCLLVAHKLKGYGLAAMMNCSPVAEFARELRERIERLYEWDTIDRPVSLA